MAETPKPLGQTAEIKNVLPDVVHSQQIPVSGTVVNDETESVHDTGQTVGEEAKGSETPHDEEEISEIESISENIPSKMEYSETESVNVDQSSTKDTKVETDEGKSHTSSVNIPVPDTHHSESLSLKDPQKQSTSWNLEVNPASEVHLSEESPVNLDVSSEYSKDIAHEQKTQSEQSYDGNSKESQKSGEFIDSLNEHISQRSDHTAEGSLDKSSTSEDKEGHCPSESSSGSEEIIKLDIRGQGGPKFPLQAAKIIFGPPPEGSTILSCTENIPVFQNLLSPFLVGATDGVNIEEVFEDNEPPLIKELTPEISDHSLSSSEKAEQYLLVEEVTVDTNRKEKEKNDVETTTPPKSMAPEETSFSTLNTEYKTICEEYHEKLVHYEEALTSRDRLIDELTVSLQRASRERDDLRHQNDHLANEVHDLQHVVAERSHSDHDTIKAQLSDFIKYHTMVKDDSTKFYSAVMSGTTSIHSSNGEKDMDHEEITVNYSKSDLRSSGSSEDFQTGIENKLTILLNKFESCIEENLRNKLRESLIQILCDEIGKMRIENDTDIKELEAQMKQDKQAYTIETRRLRELLAAVKAGHADIDDLRQELSIKHEKEMENLRTYFEKKCSDMERSYSEEVWRGRCASPPGSAASDPERELELELAAGDGRRRARSADLPSLGVETSTPLEQSLRQSSKKHEQVVEELKAEHLAYVNELQARHKEAVASLEEQITALKAHIQTAENTEANVSLYQQDIDLELEKDARLQRRLDRLRQEMLQQLQDQLQVLLSDPDAELSSWPLELVALRDRIHGDARPHQEKEVSSIREEAAPGEDKWRQRRNNSFDQNRQLEEVTKERDVLKRVAAALQRAVAQLLAYCARAEDELNRTVLASLLQQLLADETLESESRPSSPGGELDTSTRRVHFAPDLGGVLAALDEAPGAALPLQRDLSADIKLELDLSLRRLRQEAQELLELTSRLAANRRQDTKMLESSEVQITEMVDDFESKRRSCNNCEMHRKNAEEAVSEGLQRESLLRADLEAAMMKIAQLLAGDRPHSDVIAEGYGLGPVSGAAGACRSLDDASPRAHAARLAKDLDALQQERDDLQQQVRRLTDSPVHKVCCHKLEAANRQLRATRQFVEEQAGEREAERDEHARREAALRDDNARLAARLHTNARILSEMGCLRLAYCNCREHDQHVEQLEAQAREMNQLIAELERGKANAEQAVRAGQDEAALLRDVVASLEATLEQRTTREAEILRQLDQMKRTIDERDDKMRALLEELEALRHERAERSDVTCARCAQEDDRCAELSEKVKEQARQLAAALARRTRALERVHERSAPVSEPSEDVSVRDLPHHHLHSQSPEPAPEGEGSPESAESSPRAERLGERLGELARVWAALDAHARAQAAALRRLQEVDAQRKHLLGVAQEVRAERDVLQARMSEQALRISSLAARLQRQRNDAAALAHSASSDLAVRLHDAHAEVQRLKEEMESKDKQLLRLKQSLEEREKTGDQQPPLYGNSCNPKDKVVVLERELSSAQARIAQLEAERARLQAGLRDRERALADREDQLNDLMALKLEEDDEPPRAGEGKASARTLSDIVSISDFDEQDLQMRRAELKHNLSLTGLQDTNKSNQNRTLPPDVRRPDMSSLNLEYIDQLEAAEHSPRADSLPAHLTSTQNKDVPYKRNVNEITVFGADKFGSGAKQCVAQKIQDNCSMYPNRDASESLNVSVEPKKINFSLEATDNKIQEECNSLKELGITLDIQQESFPDVLRKLKQEIKKSRSELESCKSELKNAEEQLCEFPALKGEVEELKALLENTMATMENDKKFYENQLESFASNKKLLEQRLAEMTEEASEKSKDLHLLKEDILRRENMILELAKEKRNLTNKLAELEGRIEELQSRNAVLEKFESENRQLRDKTSEFQKLEQMVTEKNQQIDSLNQHLDRFDDLQRCLNDKTEELDGLKEALEEKTNELFQLQDSIDAQTREIAKINEENIQLSTQNKELKLKLTKLEKEQENASLKLQNSESELERMSSLNNELTSKIEELKQLTDKLKDKETEIEILNEDINAYHSEIAALKEQLKMASRSPSPRGAGGAGAGGGEGGAGRARPAGDQRQLARIKKQISLLQHELDFNKKELNDKAFELAKARLDVTELRNSVGQAGRRAAELEASADQLRRDLERANTEKQQLSEQLQAVQARLREEADVSEVRAKLRAQAERARQLEDELQDLRDLRHRDRSQGSPSEAARALAVRSPTAELERALRDTLSYSHALDDDIMDQILSASSDERDDIPRLALNTSNSPRSAASSSSERLQRLRAEHERLQLTLTHLQARLQDKDALIAELNRIRDKVVADWQAASLRAEVERDNAARLQLLLDQQKDSADTLQKQDSSMISMLKRRLESAMQSQLELQQREQRLQRRLQQLTAEPQDHRAHELENLESLRSEVSLLKSKLELERARAGEHAAAAERARAHAQHELDARAHHAAALRADLAELRRLKQESGAELVRAQELIRTQAAAIAQLEGRLRSPANHRPHDTMTQLAGHKTELSSLRHGLATPTATPTAPATPAAPPAATPAPATADEKDQAIRYLHGRVQRLESWRKALVWQKRYLQRVLAGYQALERRLPPPPNDPPARGRARFKCVATVVVIVLRMAFLVRRRAQLRSLAAACLLRPRDVSTPSPQTARTGGGLARRLLRHELTLTLPTSPAFPTSPAVGDFIRRSPYTTSSPREEPFILSSPRGDVAAAYLNKLEVVSRCLNHSLENAPPAP